MTEPLEVAAADVLTLDELTATISELEQYRTRLHDETLETAKRAKMTKSAVMAKLEPELAQIDAILQQLREQQATLLQQS